MVKNTKKQVFNIVKVNDLPESARIVGVTTLKRVGSHEKTNYKIVENKRIDFYRLNKKNGILKGYVKLDETDNEYLEVRDIRPIFIILGLVIIVSILCVIYFVTNLNNKQNNNEPANPFSLETTQNNYVKPEKPIDRSKNVTLPGWGSFTIHADTTNITEGFEFHNPESNTWYAYDVYLDDKYLESVVVDSGSKVDINHLLKLGGIKDVTSSIKSYNNEVFDITNEDGVYYLEAISPNDEESSIVVVAGGKEYTLNTKRVFDYYYMTFKLCLSDTDEVLYESGLVEPGMYIQEIEINRSLSAGDYDAYVFVQPYRSDRTTKCNSGKVNLELHVR